MNIAFDAKRAFHNYSGLGNYSRLLIHSLSNLYQENQYFLYTPKYKPHPLHDFALNENCKIIVPNGVASWLPSSFWRTFFMVNHINTQNVDVFHGLSGELPVSKLNMPKVVTMHDLIFMRFPEYYATFDRKMYEKKFIHACNVADKIIAISKQTAEDCIQFLGADARKIEIAYQSCDPIFFTASKNEEVIKKYNLPDRFILSVGTIEARKNLLSLVKALQYMDDDVSLVALGGKTPYTAQVEEYIKANNLTQRVQLIHNATFRDFPAIYAAAAAFVYPSVFEGFGIPVLEALAVGTPLATSNVSSMPEVGGDAVLYFDPHNIEDIAEKVNLLLHDNEIVAKLNECRAKQLNKFSIKNIANSVNEIYACL